jgi:hypothetical protein
VDGDGDGDGRLRSCKDRPDSPSGRRSLDIAGSV